MKPLLYTALVILALLHNDIWLWHNPNIMLGLPVGLLYHIAYCVVASLLFIAIVKFIWPKELDAEQPQDRVS